MSTTSTKPPDETDHVLGKIVGSCTAQLNWYASHPDKCYFAAPHKVLTELTEQMKEHYASHRASEKDENTNERERTYMTFFDWMSSPQFKEAVGTKYTFSEPYLVGSAYTPMRRPDSMCDVVLSISEGRTRLTKVPQEALHIFSKAFCQKFLIYDSDEIYVKNNTVFFDVKNCSISVRLTHICGYIPFAVRLTAAINQYDSFLDCFPTLCFFLQSWRVAVTDASLPGGRLAVPDSHTMTLLLVHFLQYYEELPHLFNNPAVPMTSYLVGGLTLDEILKFARPAYHQNLLYCYRNFQKQREGSIPSSADLLIMFFFHYGYLVDLVNYEVSLKTGDFNVKEDMELVELVVVDPDGTYGQEVPDAYKFQFLCREAFHIIKNTQNHRQTLERLLRMKMDKSFSEMRDRQMYMSPVNHDRFIRAARNRIEVYTVPMNRTVPVIVDGFLYSKSGDTEHWKSNPETPSKPGAGDNFFSKSEFTLESHILKDALLGPHDFSVDPKIPIPASSDRANKFFMTTTLPNPKNSAELLVLFRPPNNNKLRLIEDISLEPVDPIIDPDDPLYEAKPRSFYSLVKEGLLKEIAEQKKAEDIRKRFSAKYEALEKGTYKMWPMPEERTKVKKGGKRQAKKKANQAEEQARQQETARKKQELLKELAEAKGGGIQAQLKKHEFQYEPELKTGMVSCKRLAEMYATLRASWIVELGKIITPDTEYSGFDYC